MLAVEGFGLVNIQHWPGCATYLHIFRGRLKLEIAPHCAACLLCYFCSLFLTSRFLHDRILVQKKIVPLFPILCGASSALCTRLPDSIINMFNYSYIDPTIEVSNTHINDDCGALSNTMQEYGGFGLVPFSYQSQGIAFSDWANLFTLCLAPLIAHVFGGTPKFTSLSPKPPRWHERLWQFNPTTILWRYFIIADRRIRAKTWSPSDMAASNAYFWTTQGWDGSIRMMERSQMYSIRLPAHHRVRLFSGSTLTTVIITIQGVMAVKTLIDGTTKGGYALTINISSIFYPLAVFGLLRIFAALWLTDDYLYYGDIDSLRTSTGSLSDASVPKEEPSVVEVRAQTTMSLLGPAESISSERFHRTDSWRAIIFRILYLVPVCCLLAICLIYIIPTKVKGDMTVTTFLMVLFYTSFLAVSALLYGFYFLSGHSTSSIIPCFNAIWYKIYTVMLMALTLVLVILACLETRRTPCGAYTTYPSDFVVDANVCPGGFVVLPDHPQILGSVQVPFGLAKFSAINANNTINVDSTDNMKVVVASFQGICFGDALSNASDGAPVEALNNTFVPTTYL